MFFEKVILKNDPSFQNLSKAKKRSYLKIMGHKHFAYWLAREFAYSNNLVAYYFIISLLDILFFFTAPKITFLVFFILTFPIILFILIVKLNLIYIQGKENLSKYESALWLYDLFMNFGLLNHKVISKKNWKYLQKKDEDFYNFVRSDKCNHRCYETTYKLAKKLKSPDLKILWIAVETPIEKVGHAVIEKNGFLYDSNNRKTYSKKVYFKAFNVKLYKSFSLKEYSSRKFLKAEFEIFSDWCRNQDIVPYEKDD